MEKRKLTKADIDKVRNIEGFPIGTDDDIIALSDAPYYTACPNPFIEEFIKENGNPYDEEHDIYECEPFSSDVSEGKNDPIYTAHSYHTKVPYRAIMKYILHYTKPGDIVLDGFSGTGMTGVAAQMCANESTQNNGGVRYAIVNDLSPVAAFISYNYNGAFNKYKIKSIIDQILSDFHQKYSWLYETKHIGPASFLGDNAIGQINYTVWSDVFICPHCGEEFVYYDVAVDKENGLMRDKFNCPKCVAELKKKDCKHAWDMQYDSAQKQVVNTIKQTPVIINYEYAGKRYTKKPDQFDLDLIKKIDSYPIEDWLPVDAWPKGEKTGEPQQLGYKYVYQIYTKRNQIALAYVYKKIKETNDLSLLSFLTAIANRNITRCNRFMINKYNPQGRINGPMPGNLYISPLIVEQNAYELLSYKSEDVLKMHTSSFTGKDSIVTNQSTTSLPQIPDKSIDYIFTDPPFGYNINYSELNYINESWLRVKTNSSSEAIMSPTQGKGLPEYQKLMQRCFEEYYRVLKPNRWITVEFHNSKNAIWNAIQEALSIAGFIVADVRTLDKKQGSINQDNAKGAVQQDLVISAYKPKDSFSRDFSLKAGSEKTAWTFVRQHLSNLPVTVKKGGRLEVIAERQPRLLWDRMVAYHIMHGISVPMDASDFYNGLEEKFLKRDGMCFLPAQVNKYDKARATCDIDIQFTMFVSDEKSAIGWLYRLLDSTNGEGPLSYADIMPRFMQELKAIDTHEKMPELSVILDENFLCDNKGNWYIPDYTKSGDIAKLREKNLLKEFAEYQQTKGKLKVFRSEAIRAGFAKLWKDKDYTAIVQMAERLPEETIQEDSNLLMYYDISLSRMETQPKQIRMDME